MMIDFTKKFQAHRPYQKGASPAFDKQTLLSAYESDRGRILNSAAVRRLQQKTQVFPLERNAAVRSRLTHSLEVMQVGRYISQKIFKLLGSKASELGLSELDRAFETVVEMSCLLHDVGNPPFGHFGEDTIKSWFNQHLFGLADAAQAPLSQDLHQDICSFEGNAQGIRIITNLQGLNLSYTQIAAVLKYTRCADSAKPTDSYLQKKPGYYSSEAAIIDELRDCLEIEKGHRHPAAYVMEAADDIAYCIADIEDAVDKNIMDLRTLSERLITRYEKVANRLGIVDFGGAGQNMQSTVEDALAYSKKNAVTANSAYFIRLRVKLQSLMVEHAAKRFIDNIEACYHGYLEGALLEDSSVAHAISSTLKEVAFEYAFSHPEVEASELQGHHIISSLLDKYACVLALSTQEFEQLMQGSYKHAVALRMFKKIAKKHISAYLHAVNKTPELEYYFRCRMLQDHVSGMTDHYAYDEYRLLHVI